MSKKTLRVLAIISLATLLTLTGCSAMGGVSSCLGDFFSCTFEKLGCGADCLIYAEPFYCTINFCGLNDRECAASCDDCYENVLVNPFFTCANCSRSSCVNCAVKDNEDIEKLVTGGVSEEGILTFNIVHISEEHDNIRIGFAVTGSREKEASCDGDYKKTTVEVTVTNNCDEWIEDSYIVFRYAGKETICWIGSIRPGGTGTFEVYKYTRQGESVVTFFDGASFAFYGDYDD